MTRSERRVLTRLPIPHQPAKKHRQPLEHPSEPAARTDRCCRRRVRDGFLAHVVLHKPSVAVFRCPNPRLQPLPRIPHSVRTNRSGELDGPSLTRPANRSGKSRGPNTSRPACGRRRWWQRQPGRTDPRRGERPCRSKRRRIAGLRTVPPLISARLVRHCPPFRARLILLLRHYC